MPFAANLPAFTAAPIIPAFVFGEAALLWGAAAAAGPVVVHLLMRTRMKTVTFPAVRFVLAGRAANVNRLRLKHLLLLLLRALVIVVLAAALSWPGCEAAGEVEPTAAVLVFDNSPSMDYRHDGRTRLEHAREQAERIVAGFPAGSEVAVLELGHAGAPPTWRTVPVGEGVFAGVRPSRQTAAVSSTVARALDVAADHRFARRTVYVFTDRTAHAWREPLSLRAGRVSETPVVLVDCSVPVTAGGKFPDRNYAALAPIVERDPITPGEPLAVQVSVRAAAARGAVRAVLHLDGREGAPASAEFVFREGLDPEPAADDGFERGPVDVRTIRLTRTGLTPGAYAGRIALEGEDPLAADDVAYFHFTVAAPFKTVFVYEPTAADESSEGRPHVYLAGMIEPRERRLRGVHRTEVKMFAADRDWPAELNGASMLVLLGVGRLPADRAAAVDRFVRAGGRLWWICSERTDADWVNQSSPVGLMPGRTLRRVELKTPAPLTAAHPAAPTVRAFGGGGAGELDRTEIRRAWEIEPRDRDTQVWATVDVGGRALPAILHRKVERGRVVMWAFSPARSWSNMQDFVPEWPVLVQETISELAGRGSAASPGMYRLGEPVRRQVNERPAGREAEWGRIGASELLTRRARIEAGGLIDLGLPDEPGNYRIRVPSAAGEPAEEELFSVNLDPAETLMQPQSPERIRERFPVEMRSRVMEFDPAQTADQTGTANEPLAGHLALLVLALLVFEAFLANRFYREEPEAGGGAAPAAN